MRKKVLFLIYLFASITGFASHIVGADFYYRYVGYIAATGSQRYEVTLKLYRSTGAGSSALGASYQMAIWRNSAAAPTTYARWANTTTCWVLDSVNNRSKVIAPTCISSGVSIQEGTYKMSNNGNPAYLDIPNDTLDYFLGWGASARVGTILNIQNPTGTGLSCYTQIPKNNVYKNSNPVYLNSPVSFFCVGRSSTFNQNAYDPDGDSLSFSIVQPYNVANNGTTCNPFPAATPPAYVSTTNPTVNPNGYSFPNSPLGTASSVSINSFTGEISVTPAAVGVYIIAVAVKEYRKINGSYIFLCETRRDIQIQTGNCSVTNLAPVFTRVIPVQNADTTSNQAVTAGDTLCFKIRFKDPNSGDSLFTSFVGPIFDPSGGIATPYATLTQDTAKDSVTSSFCWFTQCPHARAGSPYIFTFNVADNNCNSTQKTFTILVRPKAVLNPPNLRCVDILNNDSIKLTFLKPNYLKDFDKYYLYRRTGVTGSCVLIDSLTDSTLLTYIDKNATNALSVSYGYTLRTRSTCNVYGPGCDTVNSIVVNALKLLDHCTGIAWNRHRQNSSALYKVYRTVNNVKTLVDSTRNIGYIKCDCNASGKYSVEVLDSLLGCISHSNITANFINLDTTAPKAIVVQRATVNTSNQIQLDFPKSDSADATMYIIYRSATPNGLTPFDSIPAVPAKLVYNYIDNSAINSGPYYYRIQIKDSCGNRSLISAPHSPVDLTGTNGNAVSKLNWIKNYVGYTFTGQVIQRKTGVSSWSNFKTLNATDTFFNDTNVIACGVYYYRIKTINSADTTIFSLSDSVLVQPFDTIKPLAPNVRRISVTGAADVTLEFDTSFSTDTKTYFIYGAVNGGAFTLLDSLIYPIARPIAYTWTGLNPQLNTYSMYVTARDSCGNNYSISSVSHTHVQLSGSQGNLRNTLNWTNYLGRAVSSYQVQRYEIGSGLGWSTIKTLTALDTSFTDSVNIKGCYTYAYRIVSSFTGFAYTSLSDTLALTPFDLIAPNPPSIAYVSVINNTTIKLVVNKSTSLDVNRYEIFYKTSVGGYRSAGIVIYPAGDPFVFIHTGLYTPDSNYTYYVKAIDSCGNNVSLASAIHTSILLSSSGGAMTNLLSWTKYVGWTPLSYTVQRLINGTWTSVKTLLGSDSTWADTSSLKCNQPNSYRVYALKFNGDTSYSDTTLVAPYDTIRPAAPFIRSVSVVNNTDVKISFNKVADQDVNRYEIWYATNGGAYSLLTTIFYPLNSPVSFTQTGLNTLSDNYSYYVLAIDSCSNNISQTGVAHTDIQLQSAPGNLTSKLSWSKYVGFTVGEYRVERLIGGNWTFIKSLPGSDSIYSDTSNIGCNYTYAYRVLGINTATLDTSYSDSTMVTPFDTIRPNQPIIKAVTVLTNTSVKITWRSSNPDVNKYIIYRKDASGIYVKIDSVYYDTTYSDYNAQPHLGTEYYAIQAVDSCAENKSILSAPHRTLKLDLAYQKCPKGIILFWNSYQNWPLGVVNYEIYRSDSLNAETLIHTNNGSTVTYIDTTVMYSRVYYYRIKAIQNGGSEISWSDSTDLRTPMGDGPDIQLVSVIVTSSTVGSILIQWNATRYNPYVRTSRLYYSPSGLPGTYTILYNNIPLSVTSYTHSNLDTKSRNHYYYMISYDSCGKVTDSISLHRSINLTLVGGQLVNLMHWSAYTGWTPKYYILERASKWNPVFNDLDTIPSTDTAFVDFPAPCNVDLYYRIKAVSFDGFVSMSDTAITVAIDTLPPDKPRMKNATVYANGVNQLDYVTADSTDVFGYALYRKKNNGNWFNTRFYQFAVPTVPHTIYDSTANTLLDYNQYVLITLDSCLNATASDTFAVIQLRGRPDERKNVLAWHPFKGYKTDTVQVQKWTGIGWINYARIVKDTNFLDSPLICNTVHTYRIWTRESNGSRITISDSIQLIPYDSIHPQPVVLNYTTILNNTQVSLRWKLTDLDAKDYIIQRKINNGIYVTIDTLRNYPTTYTDNVGSTLQNTFSYRIVAYDTCSLNHSDTVNFNTAVQLTGLPQQQQTTLNWNSYIGFGNIKKYYIQKLIAGVWVTKDSVNGNINSYIDRNQPCSITQHYRILTKDTNNIYFSLSDTLQLTPFDTVKPQAPQIRFVTVASPTSITVVFDTVVDKDVNRYQVFESVNGGTFILVNTISAYQPGPITFNRTGIDPMNNHYYYYVTAIDSCSNNTSLNFNVHGEVEIKGAAGNMQSILKWHPYKGFGNRFYNIQRLNGGNWITIGTLNNNDTNYIDTWNISCNVNYYYRIQTVDMGINAYYSISDTLQIIPFDTVKPLPAVLKYVTVTASNTVKIKWDFSPSGDVKFYEVHRISPNGTDSYVGTAVYADSLFDIGVAAQQNSYCYYVIAIDSCNALNRSVKSNKLCTIELQIATGGCVPMSRLKWTSCKSFDELPVVDYQIWRSDNGGAWNAIRTVASADTSFTDSTVAKGNSYCYVIKTWNASNTYLTISDSACITPWVYAYQQAPELDVASVTSSSSIIGKVTLRWKAIVNTDTLTRGYRIYHSNTGAPGSFSLISDLPNRNATTFTHTNINTYSVNHYYFMVAYDVCNYNGDTSITHRALNISIVNGNLASSISWNKYQGFQVKEYEILKSFNGVSYFSFAKTDSNTINYTDTLVSCNSFYWYRVKAIENGGDNEVAWSDIDSVYSFDTIPPSPIVIKQVTVSVISKVVGEITVTYNANTERNRNGYKIYRSLNGASFSLLAWKKNTSNGLLIYKDQGLNTLDNIYSYIIRVTDSCGNEGAPSDIHTAVNVSVNAYNSANAVTWNTYDGFDKWHYVIERYTSVNPTWIVVGGGLLTSNVNAWNDSNIICDVAYFYRIKTYDDNDATVLSMSDTAGCVGFETYPPNIPIFLRATVAKSSKVKGAIQLDWIHSSSSDASYYLIYRRRSATGSWSLIARTGYVNTFIDADVNTLDYVYEYKIACEDNCRNISSAATPHATINLTTVPGNNRSFLSWTAYEGFVVDQYEIYADGALIDNVPGTQLNYEDSMLSCDTAVVYQIKALELNGNTQVTYSDTSACIPYDIIPPAPVYLIAASVEQPENLVKLQWAPMPEWDGDHYNIFRKIGNEGWLQIYRTSSPYETSYIDKTVNAGDTNVYYILTPTDNCYNTGDYGNEAKTILLRGTSDRLIHKIWWSSYHTWSAGVLQYDIVRAEDNGIPYVLATVNAGDSVYYDTTFTSNVHNYCYYIQAHENPGSYDAISNSNIICLSQHPVIWIPNAFSPAISPNLNDYFQPSGLYFEKYEMKVYNRWGELMFESTPAQPAWDGKFKGEFVPIDTYIYHMRITGYDHEIYDQKGTVMIAR